MWLLGDLSLSTVDITSIAWWVTNFGFPGVICFMMYTVWKTFKPIIIEHVPLVKEFFVRHFDLMTVAQEQLKSGTVSLTGLKQDVGDIKTAQSTHTDMLKSIHQKVHKDE